MRSIPIPLYTRASDRSIDDCPASWHIANQGIEENTASWFEIGTALHLAIEHTIIEGLTLRKAVNRGVKYVLQHLVEGEVYKPMLWSPNRPQHDTVDKRTGELVPGVERLAKTLMATWYADWMVKASDRILPWVQWPPVLETFIQVQEADMPGGLAGMRTQADALFTCRRCKGSVIVDWKSGRTKRSDPAQLQTYRWGLEKMGHRMCACKDRGWGFFYHMEWGEVQQVDVYDAADVEWMMSITQRTKKVTPIEAIPSWKCDWCVGRSVCPAWQQDPADQRVAQINLDLNRERYVWESDPAILKEET